MVSIFEDDIPVSQDPASHLHTVKEKIEFGLPKAKDDTKNVLSPAHSGRTYLIVTYLKA